MSAKLYELAPQVAALLNMDDLPEHAISDTLEGLGFNDKVAGCIALVKNMQAESAMFDDEIKRLQARKKSADNKTDALKDYVLSCLQVAGVKKAGSTLHGATVAKGSKPKIIIDDVNLLPASLVKTEIAPDKAAILAAILQDQKVTGAHIEHAKDFLRIN